ncbi:hypothetical protein BLNAU_3854 [Blattamonas nauphoetae]|uniref:Uncharacterized protein n=1 Tax=Blattamonas nauphoetae TaxID=2049346 RepID=A0ABQ9YBP9_9EUKA|nr:hypothetical protein BLNAU_3854 [Blattamonas nauphoetae]
MAFPSIRIISRVVERDPPTLTLLPSPIFPSSSPHQQYSELSFLAALTKILRIVFSDFQRNLPTDPSHLQNYIQITKNDPFLITRSLEFCGRSFRLPLLLLTTDPPIEVDSKIIRELILFVKETLPTILTNISTIDTLIASLHSDSSPTTPLVSGVDTQMIDSLKRLRDRCEVNMNRLWGFFIDVTFNITEPHKSSFQTIILDDASFPDLILNSLKLNHKDIRENVFIALSNTSIQFERIKAKFMTANLVVRMFETVDFVSLPLSESKTLYHLARFITWMFDPIGNDEHARHFHIFIFNNSDKLILNEKDETRLETDLCRMHRHIKNMELRLFEHDTDFVSELVKWERSERGEMRRNDRCVILVGIVGLEWTESSDDLAESELPNLVT